MLHRIIGLDGVFDCIEGVHSAPIRARLREQIAESVAHIGRRHTLRVGNADQVVPILTVQCGVPYSRIGDGNQPIEGVVALQNLTTDRLALTLRTTMRTGFRRQAASSLSSKRTGDARGRFFHGG